ncbi:MAG: RecBCD enzyme subunit RecB [Chlamydiales bacterium]|nr:RecBCD enzyme subunit RecB [Chlamydiales bacterium]
MRGFDVLAPDLPLFENHFLEASAGTGKTFAIENLVLRMLEEGVALEEILIVTFTRAATIELKERIRRHLSGEQLAQFDEAKIWTIHSFCFHCLQEHALQTGFSLDQIEQSAQTQTLKEIIKDALRTSNTLTPKQFERAIQGNSEALINQLAALASQRLPIEQPDWDYTEELAQLEKVDPEKLLEDLIALAPRYGKLCDRQKEVKLEILEGLKRFTQLIAGEKMDPVDLPILRYTEDNRLKREVEVTLHYPGFLGALQRGLIPKLALFSDRVAILAVLAEEARLHLERVIEEEELVFFEDLLRLMARHVRAPLFAQTVRSSYRAVLIDEFQDTDPQQWKIFSTLFLTDKFEGPLYLVGDPKQSIYRFRNADLYTYLEAKKAMGEKSWASLQTNYRSTPSLVESLNTLFAKPFITLPKRDETLPCPPVLAASELSPIDDGKGSLHFLLADTEEALFSTIVQEIVRLEIPLHECAVLVSDRFQADRFMHFCPLPTVSKKSRSLLDTPAFETLIELVRAAQNPRDRSAVARVLAGPFFRYSLDALPDEAERFYCYHHLLETEGVLTFFQTVVCESRLNDAALYQDLLQLVEMAAVSGEDPLCFLHRLMQLDPDSEQLKARAKSEQEAIQVMTIHVSKGLEFSVVFPIGVATPYSRRKGLVRGENRLVFTDPFSEAEEHSEKMRQLYVACTRAKLRLYIPVLENHSPITTFLEGIDLSVYSSETCQIYPPVTFEKKQEQVLPAPQLSQTYTPYALHSYTSLAPPHTPEKRSLPEGIIPAGPQTGILIHELFEKLPFAEAFQAKTLLPFVTPELKGTFLEPWTEEVASMMQQTLHLPLPGPDGPFPLSAVDPQKILKEMEFLFPSVEPPGFFKGFIDLFFEYEGGFYILDWKTNYLTASVEEAIEEHSYALQASIYQQGVERYLSLFYKKPVFKGSFYLFLRSQEIYHFFNNK